MTKKELLELTTRPIMELTQRGTVKVLDEEVLAYMKEKGIDRVP